MMTFNTLPQLLADENPYGDVGSDVDIDKSIATIRNELAALRTNARTELTRVDGPTAKNNRLDPTTHDPKLGYGPLMQGLFWYFQGKPVRISKAMKLVYTAPDGTPYSILVGFEGAGGGM